MKRTIVAFCFVFAARIHAGDAGLFQLFAGTIQHDDRPIPVVLKINTQTGETWQLLEVPVKLRDEEYPSGYATAWTPVSEDMATWLQKLQGARRAPNAPTPKASSTP